MRSLLRTLGWLLPPATFFAWLLWTVAGEQNAAITAFGPVDIHLTGLRWSLAYKMGLGALFALGWTGCWTYLKRTGAPGRPRRRARPRHRVKVASPGRS